jgi:methionyl-tRNA formyltransferase
MRVLFWGTSDYAVPTLHALLASRHTVAGVVTQPDRKAGRGRSLRPTPVREVAAAAGLPILQPEKPRGEEFLATMMSLRPEISVVAAYGEILPEPVLEAPPRGTLNVHASLLPELRGAAPINWAIIRGHRRTGVTIIRLVRELDAGPILLQQAVPIGPATTAGELFDVLAELGARLLLESLDGLASDSLEPREQEHAAATYAPKLDRDACRLDWSLSAVEVDRWIRGCDPWPAAWSLLEPLSARGEESVDGPSERRESLPVQIFRSRPVADGGGGGAAPGTILVADAREGLRVAAGVGSVQVGDVKPAGRARMSAPAWIRGRGAEVGQRFR